MTRVGKVLIITLIVATSFPSLSASEPVRAKQSSTLLLAKDRLIATTPDGTIWLFSMKESKLEQVRKHETTLRMDQAVLLEDQKSLLTSKGNKMYLVDLETGRLKAKFLLKPCEISMFTWSPHKKWLGVRCTSGSVKVIGPDRNVLRELEDDETLPTTALALSANGNFCLGDNKGNIYDYKVEGQEPPEIHSRFREGISKLSVSNDNRYLITLTESGELAIYDLLTKKWQRDFSDAKDKVHCWWYEESSCRLVLSLSSKSVCFYDVKNRKRSDIRTDEVLDALVLQAENGWVIGIAGRSLLVIDPKSGKVCQKYRLGGE